MEANKLTIIPPEGMEAYQEGNEIKFRPIKNKLTYEDIAKKLFSNNITYYTNLYGGIYNCPVGLEDSKVSHPNNCTSEKQVQKLLAINKLMNVAKYLNGDWQPDWNSEVEDKYYIYATTNIIDIASATFRYSDVVYFKSRKLAEQAIEILGKETIKLALCTDW